MKRDFILALSMFVACAVVGSILGVWMVARFQGQHEAARAAGSGVADQASPSNTGAAGSTSPGASGGSAPGNSAPSGAGAAGPSDWMR